MHSLIRTHTHTHTHLHMTSTTIWCRQVFSNALQYMLMQLVDDSDGSVLLMPAWSHTHAHTHTHMHAHTHIHTRTHTTFATTNPCHVAM